MEDLALGMLFWTIFAFGMIALWVIVPFSLGERMFQKRIDLYLAPDERYIAIALCLQLALVMVLFAGTSQFQPPEIAGIGLYCVAVAAATVVTRRRLQGS